MKLLVAAAAALLTSVPAYAVPVTDTFTINASNFTTAGSPYSSVVGTFSVTFDNAANLAPTRNGFTVSNFTLNGYDTQVVYSKSRDWLTFGTNLLSTGGCSVTPGANQFCFIISNASTTFTPYNQLAYAVQGTGSAYQSVFTVTRVAAAVPEPAAWATMISGLGAVGFALRRRRKTTTRLACAA